MTLAIADMAAPIIFVFICVPTPEKSRSVFRPLLGKMNREMRNVNVAAQASEIRFSLQNACFVLIAPLPSADTKRRLTLWDIREPMLTIVCQPCGRRGRFSVARADRKAWRRENSFRSARPDCHSCVDAPLDARGFSSDSGNVVRRFRVSGLIVRQFTRRGPVWKSEDRVQIGVARSKRSE